MGKNGKFGKDYGKVVGKDSKTRPGWKGPAYVKKAEVTSTRSKKQDEETPDEVLEPVIPTELQQLLLNIFRDGFPEVLNSDCLQPLLQDVKAALYERDFGRKSCNTSLITIFI
jgi:25S rRNA (uracil2843-N3)-methyltransferase